MEKEQSGKDFKGWEEFRGIWRERMSISETVRKSTKIPQGPSMLLQMAKISSFL